MPAETNNTWVKILRGTSSNATGDIVDSGTVYLQDVPATLIETTKTVWDPANQVPRTIRVTQCWLPEVLGVLNSDQLVDQSSGFKYIISGVQQPSSIAGVSFDTRYDLKRVTATGP